MRVMSFCPRYVPMLSGGETAAHALNVALAARGHEVSVVTSTQPEDRRVRKELGGVEVYYGRIRPRHARYVEEREPDVLFAQFEMSVPTVRFALEVGLPVVVFCHGPYGYTELAEHGLAHAVDLFIFNSVFLLSLANRNVHHVVVNPPLDRERVRAPEGLDRRFVTLVNLHDNKGPHIFHTLARIFIDKPFLAVKGAYGQQLVEDLPNVELRETTPHIGRVYGESRVVLIPSAEESFGLVGVEAQSNGVPVIASDLPSLRESLGDGALFVAREDIAGWVTALRQLDDADFYAELSRRARANADSFDTALDVDVLVTVLEAMLRRYRWRRRPTLARLHEEREERSRRIREIFRRGLQREPTFTELLTFLDGTQSLVQLEHVIPALRGRA
ncbi:MAG: glycosyltransferase family 4 protein [Myxococcales bacterium]|nr:glycosyltransferase family 4 protein [Myxococcales bacterium]